MSKKAMYEMHKYWGKKPSVAVVEYIKKYSKKNDLILDPFSGYGVIACEAFLQNRNVIANDLNPISNFINFNLFNNYCDFNELQSCWKKIKCEFESFNNEWYSCNINGKLVPVISTLRTKEDVPVKIKYKEHNVVKERELSEYEIKSILLKEENAIIEDWYPKNILFENSRICAKRFMTVDTLFTKRELCCLSKLLALIEKYSEGIINSLLKLAFSANIANCSKLVPPIKSRGDMSQGAWMTGFYIGETYIENNVLHYFENRLTKVIKGKKQFLECSKNVNSSYIITNNDSRNLFNVEDNSIDYILTDPPYGGTVPYFEQSIIWNSWLRMDVNYENEIVVSDSKERNKDISHYEEDIKKSFNEIYRILKKNSYFTFTFHSVSGKIWKSIINACLINNFDFVALDWMFQETFSPRQLNRKLTVKGDITITLKKIDTEIKIKNVSNFELENKLLNLINSKKGLFDTNSLYLIIISYIFENKYLLEDLDIINFLHKNFQFEEGKWRIE